MHTNLKEVAEAIKDVSEAGKETAASFEKNKWGATIVLFFVVVIATNGLQYYINRENIADMEKEILQLREDVRYYGRQSFEDNRVIRIQARAINKANRELNKDSIK